MIKKLYREEFETALRDAPVGSIVIDDDGDVFRYTGDECGFLLPSSPSEAIAYRVLADYVSYPVMLIEMGSVDGIRIVSSPPPKVGFYMQDKGFAFYWDGSVWRYSKGGMSCDGQDYGFSSYIGDVKEDK